MQSVANTYGITIEVSCPAGSHLPHLIGFDSLWPYTFNCLATWQHIATEAVLHIVLPFTWPLPSIGVKICSVTLTLIVGEIPDIFLTTLPLYLALTFKNSVSPGALYRSAIIKNKNALTLEPISSKASLIHSALKIKLSSTCLRSFLELAFIKRSVWHFVLPNAMRNIFPELSFVWWTVREGQLTRKMCLALLNLSLVRNPIGRLEVYFLMFC